MYSSWRVLSFTLQPLYPLDSRDGTFNPSGRSGKEVRCYSRVTSPIPGRPARCIVTTVTELSRVSKELVVIYYEACTTAKVRQTARNIRI